MTKLGKWMEVDGPFPSASGKTSSWSILDRHGGLLGSVRWFGRWRCYAFNPQPMTVYNAGCMEDLAKFCSQKTLGPRSGRKRD